MIKIKNPSRIFPLFLCLLVGGCSLYNKRSSSDHSRPPLVHVPPPEQFEEADTNNDNVIDKEEALAFQKKEKEKKSYPFEVIIWILVLSLVACFCTPAVGRSLKKKFISLKEFIKKRFSKKDKKGS